MANIKNIPNLSFEEFNSVDLSTWKEKIEADLKGKTWSSFLWEVESGVLIDPAQLLLGNTYPPLFAKKEQLWIGQSMEIGQDLEIANGELLELLMKGVSAPQLQIERTLSVSDWSILFNQVELQYLSPTFLFTEVNSAAKNLENLSSIKQLNKELKGIIKCTIATLSQMQELRLKVNEQFPLLKTSTIQINADVNTEEIAATLKSWLEMRSIFSSSTAWLKATNLEVTIGDNFLKEIGKLRAIHAIVNLISEELKIDGADLSISVCMEQSSLHQEAELAIIQLTNRSIVANLGGADQILLPILAEEKTKFYQRITSNIQHILSLESNMDRVGDPLAGSHFIEAVTEKIATTVWQKLTLNK